jgi:hypothetical protein
MTDSASSASSTRRWPLSTHTPSTHERAGPSWKRKAYACSDRAARYGEAMSSRIEGAKNAVELGKAAFDLGCAIYDRLKRQRDEQTKKRIAELEAENAALKAAQHL